MPVQIYFGDNTLEIEEAVRAIRQTFQSTDALSFDGASATLPELTEACLTAGLFDPERLVIVRNLHERLKGARKEGGEMEEIAKLLGSLPPTTTLILVSPGMSGDHALVKAVRAVGGAVRVHETPKRRDLPRWIVQRGESHGARVDPDAADLLAELLGSNAVMIETELEKLATYAGAEGRITPDMVETLVGSVTQDSIFALVDAIAGGDQKQAFHLLHAQRAESSSTPIEFALYLIRMLARQVRILLRIRLGQEAGRSTAQITSDLKLPRYYADRYFRQARRLSRQQLQGAFELLAALEFGLKSGTADAEAGLDLLVTELCA